MSPPAATGSAVDPRSVGVVGLGYFSRFHLEAWRRLGRRIEAVHDLDPARTDEVARAHGASACASIEEVVRRAPSILDIVAPPPAHADAIRAAAGRVAVIVCQKPFCTSLDEARATARLAAERGSRLIVHENFRFQPWHRAIKAHLDRGAMGAVWSARFALRPGDGRGPEAYAARQPAFRTMPRLLLHETGVHFADLFRWLFGPARSVYAEARRLNPAIAGEDEGLMILHHEGGARSTLDGNRLADHVTDSPRRTMGTMAIEGEGGVLELDGSGRLRHRAHGASDFAELPVGPVDEDAFGGGCTHALCEHVVAAMRGERAFENEALDYLPVIATIEAAYRSVAEGRRIEIGT